MSSLSGLPIVVTLKHLLQQTHSDFSPTIALALLSTHQSGEIILPSTEGCELRLGRVIGPTAEQEQRLHQLGVSLPERFYLNLEYGADSAIALADFKPRPRWPRPSQSASAVGGGFSAECKAECPE